MTAFVDRVDNARKSPWVPEEHTRPPPRLFLNLAETMILASLFTLALYASIHPHGEAGSTIIAYSSIGFVTGILVGAFGIGGGSILTPTLILALNVSPIIAVGSDLFHAFLMKTVGAIKHYKWGTIDIPLAKRILVGAVPSSLVTALLLSKYMEGGGNVSSFIELILSIVLMASGPLLLIRSGGGEGEEGSKSAFVDSKAWRIIPLIGMAVGIIVSLTSVGAGVLMMPLLALLLPISLHRLVGVNILTAVFLTAAPSLAYLYFRLVDLNLVGMLLLGSIPGVLLGVRINHRFPGWVLKPVLCVLLVTIGFIMVLWR